METIDWAKVERQFFALEMVRTIIMLFERATRGRRGRRTGLMTLAGMDVFETLARQRGAFARPVPLRRDDLVERCRMSQRRIDLAVQRLVAEDFLIVSGSSDRPMVQLQIPGRVFETYRRHANEIAQHPDERAIERHDLDDALSLLDDPDFDQFADRERVLLQNPWLGHADRPA